MENCNSDWLLCAREVLEQNGFEESYFAEQVFYFFIFFHVLLFICTVYNTIYYTYICAYTILTSYTMLALH